MADQDGTLLDGDPGKGAAGGKDDGNPNPKPKDGSQVDDPNKGKPGQDPNGGGKDDQKGKETPEALHDAAIAAVEAWQANPTPELKEAALKATTKAKEAAAAAKQAAQEASAKNKAPEKYADFRMPEGLTPIPEVMDKFTAMAKEMNMSQEAAQKLIDLQSEAITKASEKSQKDFSDMRQEWRKETLTALGKDAEVKLGLASKAIDKLGGPDLRALLKDTGLGNNKNVVLFLVKVGEMVSEDGFVDGQNKNTPKSDGEIFYPSMAKK